MENNEILISVVPDKQITKPFSLGFPYVWLNFKRSKASLIF